MTNDEPTRAARILSATLGLLAISGLLLIVVGGLIGEQLGAPAGLILWPSLASWVPIALYGAGLLIESGWCVVRRRPAPIFSSGRGAAQTVPILIGRLLLGLLLVVPFYYYVLYERLSQGLPLEPIAHW